MLNWLQVRLTGEYAESPIPKYGHGQLSFTLQCKMLKLPIARFAVKLPDFV